MAEATNESTAVRLLDQKLDWVGGLVQELKSMVTSIDQRLQAVERTEERHQVEALAELDRVKRTQERQQAELEALERRQEAADKAISKLMHAYQLLVFVAAAFGLSCIALMWALITGQAEVVFR